MTNPDTPSIEALLSSLHPICSARRQSLGWKECGRPAAWVVALHAIDNCANRDDIDEHGNAIETLCAECLNTVSIALANYARKQQFYAGTFGAVPCCKTCGTPKTILANLLTVRPIGEGS